MCLCRYRRGTSHGHSSQWAGKIAWCKLKDRQRSEQKRRCSDRHTDRRLLQHIKASVSPLGHLRQNQAGHLEQNHQYLNYPDPADIWQLFIKVTSVQKGNIHNRWGDGQKGTESDEERKGETALCGKKTDSIPGYGTATGRTHTWQTEVMFTLIMLLMNWKQKARLSEHHFSCDILNKPFTLTFSRSGTCR